MVATQDAPIVISDLLPAGVTLSNDVVSGGGDVTCLAVGTEEGRELVECRRPLTLGVGESFTVTLNVVLDSALTGDSVANTASVTGTTPEPEGPNTNVVLPCSKSFSECAGTVAVSDCGFSASGNKV